MDIPEIIDEPADRLGMTDDQWEWFQKATHGYGEQDENGIDLSLLRANLRLTPTERLEQHFTTVHNLRLPALANKIVP
jgi:hypothetical protein